MAEESTGTNNGVESRATQMGWLPQEQRKVVAACRTVEVGREGQQAGRQPLKGWSAELVAPWTIRMLNRAKAPQTK